MPPTCVYPAAHTHCPGVPEGRDSGGQAMQLPPTRDAPSGQGVAVGDGTLHAPAALGVLESAHTHENEAVASGPLLKVPTFQNPGMSRVAADENT